LRDCIAYSTEPTGIINRCNKKPKKGASKKNTIAGINWRLSFQPLLQIFALLGLLAIPLLASAESKAALGQPNIDYYAPVDYRAHHQNWTIKQHADGSLYAANNNGILEFDGERWTLITVDNFRFIYDLALDETRLYLGTDRDLGYFERDLEGQWQYHSIKTLLVNDTNQPVNIEQILRVSVTPRGVYYLGAKYLYRYYEQELTRVALHSSNSFYAISWVNKKVLIGDISGKIYRFDPATETISLYLDTPILGGYVISEFRLLKNGNTLIVALNGLFKLTEDPSTKKPSVTKLNTNIDSWIENNEVRTATELDNGHLALGTRTAAIAIIDQQGQLQQFINQSSGLKHARVTRLLLDNQQGLWATHDGGISRIAMEHGFYRFAQKNGFANIEAIIEHEGDIYAGSRSNGLFRLRNPSTDITSQFLLQLGYSSVWALAKTEAELIVGYGTGIDIIDTNSTNLVIKQRLRTPHVFSLTQTNNSTFFATLANGVARLTKEGDQWVISAINLNTSIDQAVFEPPDTLWLGGMAQEYIRLNNISQWPNIDISRFDDVDGVPTSTVNLIKLNDQTLFETAKGILKFNEYSATSNLRFTQDPHFQKFHAKDHSQNPYPISQNPDGSFFYIQNNLLTLAKLNNDNVYDKVSAGIKINSNERINALYQTKSAVWVSGDKAVYRFDRSLFDTGIIKPELKLQLLITDYNQAFYLTEANHTDDSWPVVLNSTTEKIKVMLALRSFNRADDNQYRWRINGTWSDWQYEGEVIFDHLTKGKQLIEFQGKNSLGTTSKIETLTFIVSPHWYSTLIFKVAMFLALGLLLFLSVRYFVWLRTQHLEREKTRLQRMVKEKTQSLQQIDALKTQFFCNITHEIRTPLTLNIGTVEHIIDANPNLEKAVKRQLNQAVVNAKRLLFLINQILDINRYAVKEEQLNSQTYDLNAFTTWISERFEPLAIQKQIQLITTHPDAVLAVNFDCSKMERILVNILSNSFKFTEPGDEIKIELFKDADHVTLRISDTGIGIPEQQLPFIFDRFYSQNKKHKLEYASTGIGLAIVKSLIELHGGTIKATNNRPKGSCFTLSFPISGQAPVKLDYSDTLYSLEYLELNQPTSTGSELTSAAGEHDSDEDISSILVIDDNVELRQFLVQIFSGEYLVIEANNGQEGLTKARQHYPDLIICDLMMPVMDGLEFTKICKSDPETDFIPVFLLTANGTKEIHSHGLELGADDFLEKPFELKNFKAKIKNLLTRQTKLREYIQSKNSERATVDIAPPQTTPSTDPFINEVRAYLIANIYTDIKVEALAKHFNTDRSNLYRRIHKETQLSTQNFIKDIRLNIAAEQLIQSNHNISTIAYSLGFNSLSYFTRAFKEKFDCTPNQYRRNKTEALRQPAKVPDTAK